MARQSVSQGPGISAPQQLERRWQGAFRQRWQTAAPDAWCCVGIDVGKYEHVAVAYDGRGQLLSRPLRFGIRRADYQAAHPASAALVIEAADSSLEFDRGEKGSLYSRARIAEYWIVNLKDDCLEVYRDPQGDQYRSRTILRRGETVTPLTHPDGLIAVADLLP